MAERNQGDTALDSGCGGGGGGFCGGFSVGGSGLLLVDDGVKDRGVGVGVGVGFGAGGWVSGLQVQKIRWVYRTLNPPILTS